MSFTIFLFWLNLGTLFFCYIGYGILLFFINTLRAIFIVKNKKPEIKEGLPVTLIVAAFNEELMLEQKIKNTLAIEYTTGTLKIIFVTDGSADGSVR